MRQLSVLKYQIDNLEAINIQHYFMFENMPSRLQQKKQCVKVAYEGKAATMPELHATQNWQSNTFR